MARAQSLRAYAKHRRDRHLPGGTLQAVQKAIRDRRIKVSRQNTVDPDVADAQWLASTDVARQPRPRRPSKPPPASPVPDDVAGNGHADAPDYNYHRAIREAIRARLDNLEYETKIGRMVDAREVEHQAFNRARSARELILGLSNRISAELARITDRDEVHAVLTRELRRICEVLATEPPDAEPPK